MVTKFVNQVNFDIPVTSQHVSHTELFPELDRNALLVTDLVSSAESESILSSLEASNWQPVSITGMSGNWKEGDPIGSYRASNYTPAYADVLWNRIKHAFPPVRTFNDDDNTDWDSHERWEPFAVSPLLRFIKYEEGGWLVAHYDAPYIESENVRTLQSLVVYLHHDITVDGGATRYMHDEQGSVPVSRRNLSDLCRAATEEEIRLSLKPSERKAVIFDHRLLHDAERVTGQGSKIIIRTDILYRKV